MNSIDVRFETPLALLTLIPAAVLLILSLRRIPTAQLSKKARNTHLGLRLLAVLCAVLILSGLSVSSVTNKTVMALLLDTSDSTAGRREELLQAAETIEAAADRNTQIVHIAFGGNAVQVSAFENENGVETGATDAAGAMILAANALEGSSRKRVVLLTDGVLTDGDVISAAEMLGGKGIRLDAYYAEYLSAEPEAQVTAVTLPSEAVLGQSMTLDTVVTASGSIGASLEVSDREGRLSVKQVRLYKGENRFALTALPRYAGTSEFFVKLTPEKDTIPGNNAYGAVTEVTSQQRILLVEGQTGNARALRQLLEEHECDTTVLGAAEVPTDMEALCRYSLIILLDVDVLDLPQKAPARLREYVETYGRSLLAAGGEHTFLYGNMKDTALETILPVSMEVSRSESAEPAVLLFLLDNSASMEGTPITMAKRGLINAIQSLNDNDFAGVIAFSTESSVVSPIISMENRDGLINSVARLGTVMGTQYNPALLDAEKLLEQYEGSGKKHIILLSDGNPSDTGYEEIVVRLAEKGVTLSTIAMGADIRDDVMAMLATLGGGKFYRVESSYDLPSIVLTDTVASQTEHLVRGSVTPETVSPRYGISDPLPPLGGYIRTDAKAGAEVLLTVEKNDPLFVRQSFGSGRTACFTADLSGQWTDMWFRDDPARATLVRLIEELQPTAYTAAAREIRLEAGGTQSILTARAAEGAASAKAEVTAPDGRVMTQDLFMNEECWTAEIPTPETGRYELLIHDYDAAGMLLRTRSAAEYVSYSREYDAFPDTVAAREQLQEICFMTGGMMTTDAALLSKVELAGLPVERDVRSLLAGAAFFLLLMDLTLRKLRPKFLYRR